MKRRAKGLIRPAGGGLTLPQVVSATLPLDLEADTLALADNDPVSTWADQSGNGRDFTQTGSARPTKQTVGGYPAVVFDGVDDWLLGQDAVLIYQITNLANWPTDRAAITAWLADRYGITL